MSAIQMSSQQKSAGQRHKKRFRPDPDFYRPHLEAQVLVRRKLCTFLRFWRVCSHKKCLRARACALASNECFGRLWPLVPEHTKIFIRATIEAQAAGCSPLETTAAVTRSLKRWRETQVGTEANDSDLTGLS